MGGGSSKKLPDNGRSKEEIQEAEQLNSSFRSMVVSKIHVRARGFTLDNVLSCICCCRMMTFANIMRQGSRKRWERAWLAQYFRYAKYYKYSRGYTSNLLLLLLNRLQTSRPGKPLRPKLYGSGVTAAQWLKPCLRKSNYCPRWCGKAYKLRPVCS